MHDDFLTYLTLSFQREGVEVRGEGLLHTFMTNFIQMCHSKCLLSINFVLFSEFTIVIILAYV